MAIVTVGDVMKHARDFERMLGDYYAGLAERSQREGVRLLTDYMGRHCARLDEALARLDEGVVQRILKVPLRYEPQAADCRCFEGMELPPDATAGQVLDVAMTFDECLIRLYRQVARQPVDQEVIDLFESLIHAEETDEVELKKIKAMDYF